jgi:zinc protease
MLKNGRSAKNKMNKPEIFELDNGLRCVLINNPHVGSITTHLRGRCGSNYENIDQIGVAHLLEHYITRSKKDILNKISFSGGYFVGVTSRDDVLFMTKTTSENMDPALEYTSEIFKLNDFDSASLDIQKKIVLNEIDRIYLNPERLLMRESNKILFENERMQKFNIGSKDDVIRIDTSSLKYFYDSFYTPNRFVLVLAGNIDLKKTKKKIKSLLNDIPVKKEKQKDIELIQDPEIKIMSIKHLNNSQFICNIDFYSSGIDSSRNIVDNLAAGVINEALNAVIKTKYGLVYQIRSGNFASSRYGKTSIYFYSSKENGPKVLKTVKNVINDISDKNDNSKILNRVEAIKNQYISRMIFNMEKTSGLADYYSYRYIHDAYIKEPEKEIEKVKRTKPNEIFERIKEISNQSPKITLISDKEIIEDRIKKLWVQS